MNAAVGAAAADVQVTDWMYAALPTQIVNEPWELQGALEVLWEFFAQAVPRLKPDVDAFGVGFLRLNKIMPAVGQDFVDPTSAVKFKFQPAGAGGYETRPATREVAIKDAAARFTSVVIRSLLGSGHNESFDFP